MASTTSLLVSPDKMKHDVYISFRGKDTRTNFISHLLGAFTRNCIDAFIDDTISGGEGTISDTIFNKISESVISVVVFSSNYADSPCCLDELVKINECKDNMGLTVLPVFLGVERTHVREQTGAFGDGFNRVVQDHNFEEKEPTWRRVLTETANISGWDSKEVFEDKIVEGIVHQIEKILDQISSKDQYDGYIGISRVEKVERLLHIGSAERVRAIGIWGMGGVGKTTIVKHLFHRLSNRFDGACFVGNIKARVEIEGFDRVQEDMIIQLLGMKSPSLGPYMFSPVIVRRLQRKKLLIVLDDVDNPRQLKALLGRDDIFGGGSRIIVTRRDKQVLKNGCTKVYEVKKLNNRESLMLFKIHAFKQDQPIEKLIELSKMVIVYAKGLPLALEVLGCNLHGRDIEEWKVELAKLEEIPDVEISDILRISYEGLDEKEKNIFLDIACLFQGWTKDSVEAILDGCGFYAGIGLSRLYDKALITFSIDQLWMHDLLQKMGQDVVLHECVEEPWKRSRLWRWKDIYDVLTRSMGSRKIEVMSLDLSKGTIMQLKGDVFKGMSRLRVLQFYSSSPGGIKIHLPEGLKHFPNALRYLKWDEYPLPSLPPKFHPEYLINLKMQQSHLKQLWSGEVEPCLPNLKHFDLSDSKELTRLPNFSKTLKLESLQISDCENLVEVPASVQHLVELKHIALFGNRCLPELPEFSHLTELETLVLSGCSKITVLPEVPPNIVHLDLSQTAIRVLPPSCGCLHELEDLLLNDCKELENLPESVFELKHLQDLDLGGCSKLFSLPENLGNLNTLTMLILDGTSLGSLPNSICNLGSLEILHVQHCSNLKCLPENLGDLESLLELITDGSPLICLPSSINHLNLLTNLSCSEYQGDTLPSLVGLDSLEELNLRRSHLKGLPESIKCLPKLEQLCLSGCKRLSFLPELPLNLTYLYAANCTSLEHAHILVAEDDQTLPTSFEYDFVNCLNLEGDIGNHILRKLWLRTIATNGINKKYLTRARLRIPRSEVPKWFKYAQLGSSLRVKTRQGRRLNLHRLAFCAVVAPQSDCPKDFIVKCKCLTESGEQFVSSCDYISHYGGYYSQERIIQSEHLFFWYDYGSVEKSKTSRCWFTQAMVEFYVDGHQPNELGGFEIVKCGVTPIGKRGRTTRLLINKEERDELSKLKRSNKREHVNQGGQEKEGSGCEGSQTEQGSKLKPMGSQE